LNLNFTMSYLTNLRNDADYERCFYVFANGENDLSYTLFGVCDDVLLCAYNDAKKFIDDEREYFETLDAKDAVRVAANVALLAAEKAKRDCFEIKLDMSSSTIGIMNSKLNANSAKWFPCNELMRPKLMRYDGLSKLIK
jgi:hypothetical protein